MKFLDYLRDRNISQTEFARRIGVPITTLHGWGSGRRLPPATALAIIERETEGAVTVHDFVPAPEAAAAPAEAA
jgi:DNA-binding transcriptional regulator YdaS (Cro superfamily)